MRLGRLINGMLFGLLITCALLVPMAAIAQDSKLINAYFGNETVKLHSNATTVAGFLSELSVELPYGTQIDPPLDTALKDEMNIFLSDLYISRGSLTRVIEPTLLIEEGWHFGPEMVKLSNPGRTGLSQVSFTLFHSGGVEVGRRQQEEVLTPMVPRRVVYYHALSGNDGPSIEDILAYRLEPSNDTPPPERYREVFTMETTAYEPGPTSCGPFASGNTSVGYKAGYGVVAVDPTVIPLHTRLFIEGYGYAVAGDVGSAVKGYHVDVGMLTVDECYEWGRKDARVYVLY